MKWRAGTRVLVAMVVCALVGCAAEAPEGAASQLTGDDDADSAAMSLSQPLPPELLDLIQGKRRPTRQQLDRIYTIDHDVWVGPGRFVHVVEKFTLRAWLRWPHRGVLVLPGAPVNAQFYNIDVDGYRLQDDLARQGYFAFVAEYEGTGESTYPANGLDATHELHVGAMRRVLSYVRLIRLIPRVDVLGESNGAGVAAELCADEVRTRSCTLSSSFYTSVTPFAQAVFLDPNFIGFLLSQPNGYIQVGPELLFNVAGASPPAVAAYIFATQPGSYAVQPLLEPAALPFFDPTHASVPALIIQGTADNIAAQNDSDLLAAAYGSAPDGGGVATVARIEGGAHIPRVQPEPIAGQWRALVFNFLAQ